MGVSQNFNIEPYYDDFDQTKGYVKILFKPGFGLQAREMSQLQTIIIDQLRKFGKHIFRDGSRVSGGNLVLNKQAKFIKFQITNSLGSNASYTDLIGTKITSASGATAEVIQAFDVNISGDPLTAIIQPLNNQSFNNNEKISIDGFSDYTLTTQQLSSYGDSLVLSISEGVFFIDGYFVYIAPQNLVVSKYTNTGSYKIGISLTESIVDQNSDSTLLDPARGFFNYAAPGADRYKLALSLTSKSLTDSDESFYELMRIVDGIVVSENKYPVYSEIEKTLARRTYDESGDYTVNPFILTLSEHDSDSTKISAKLSAGKAYVKGFEFETLNSASIDIDKGRNTTVETDFSISTNFGNYIIVNNLEGYIPIKSFPLIDLHCVNFEKQKSETATITLTTNSSSSLSHFPEHKMVTITSTGGTAVGEILHFEINSDNVSKLVVRNVVEGSGFDNTAVSSVQAQIGSPVSYSASSYNVDSENDYNLTKIGQARVRQIDYDSYDSLTSNTSTYHSNYSLNLFQLKFNTVLGTVPQVSTSIDEIYLQLNNTPEYDDALNGVKIKITSGDFVNQERTISDYITTSTYHKAILDQPFVDSNGIDSKISSTPTYTLTFGLKDVESIGYVDTPSTSTLPVTTKSQANISNLSKANLSESNDTLIYDTSKQSLVFPLPDNVIKTTIVDGVTKNQFNVKRTFDFESSDGTFSLTLDQSSKQTFVNSSGTNSDRENYIFIITAITDNPSYSKFKVGQYIDIHEPGKSRTLTRDSGTSVSVDIGELSTDPSNYVVRITGIAIVSVTCTDFTASSKSLITANQNIVDGTISNGQLIIPVPNTTPNGKDTLKVPHVDTLVAVYDTKNRNITPSLNTITSANNITDRYILDDGQRDTFYDHGSLILKPGATPPQGQLLVFFNWYSTNTNTSEINFFTVDSYPSSDTDTGYSLIPSFVSPTTGETFDLRRCIDFRPLRNTGNNVLEEDNGETLTRAQITQYITSENLGTTATNFINSLFNSTILPDTDYTFQTDFEYYLPRKDKIAITSNKEFKIIQGSSSLNPEMPSDDDDSMTIYNLQIPAYTFNVDDVKVSYIDNKRYTMRDIGKLEKRIENLEYFTSLTLLEEKVNGKIFTDNSGNERFKSGILVDTFKGHSVGDVSNSDYKCAIDFGENYLRPTFNINNLKYNVDNTNTSNVRVFKDTAVLLYSEDVSIQQDYASEYSTVNPYNINTFVGSLHISPYSDTFYDTSVRPKVISNLEGNNDGWVNIQNNNGFGSQWDDWTNGWTGKLVSDTGIQKTKNEIKIATKVQDSKSILGIETKNVPESLIRTYGNKTIDLSITKYARGGTYNFVMENVKPNTTYYLYVDGVDLTNNVKKSDLIIIDGIVGEFLDYEDITVTVNTSVNVVCTVMRTEVPENNSQLLYINIPEESADLVVSGLNIFGNMSLSTASITSLTKTSRGVNIVSDDVGNITGNFTIPGGQFLTGELLIRFTDQVNNIISTSTSVAETKLYCTGLIPSRDKLNFSTRPYTIRRYDPKSNDVVSDITQINYSNSDWLNPFTQTFFVQKEKYPLGTFISSIDLLFYSKSDTLPITVQIRPIYNNYPSPSYIVPFAEKTLYPNEITTSTSISNTSLTNFAFDIPVFLQPGEYAITILTNSKDYSLFVGRVGSVKLGTIRNLIPKNNLLGSFYTPSNTSTHQKDNELMLYLNIKTASFLTSGQITLNIDNSSLTDDIYYDVYKVTSSELLPSTCNVSYEESKSLITATSEPTTFTSLTPNINIYESTRKMISSSFDNSNKLRLNLSTGDTTLSPIIDLSRLSLMTIQNNINNGVIANNDIVVTDGGYGYGVSANPTVSISGGGDNVATASLVANTELILTTTTVSGSYSVGEIITQINGSDTTTAVISEIEQLYDTDGVTELVGQFKIYCYNTSSNFFSITTITSDRLVGENGGICEIDGIDGRIKDVTVSSGGTGYLKDATIIVNANGSERINTDASTDAASDANVQFISELSSNGGNNIAKYITRRVTLEDGFDAKDLVVNFSAYKPRGTNIYCYAKILASDDTDINGFDGKEYILLDEINGIGSYSLNENDYRNYSFGTTNGLSYVYNDSLFNSFKVFAIKIVMMSNNTTLVPKIKNLSVVALES